MALLQEVLDPPVGPGYHSAAQDRVAAGLPASSGTRTWLMFAVSVGLGLLGSVASVTLRAPDPAAADGRAQIVERIEEAERVGDAQSQRIEQLRAEIAGLEQEALAPQGSGAQVAQAGLLAGAVPVQGPGVVVTLDDAEQAPDAAPGEDLEPERVNARDLQLVVNGLWLAGAEAISINDHRMTSTSAIRFAGEAIIVDFRGLAPPYVVRAIGDPQALQEETTVGLTGAYLRELRQQLALRTDVVASEELTLTAGERLSTRVGQVASDRPDADPTPGEPPSADTADPVEEPR